MLKDLKPSTRQRFVALDFEFPRPEREAAIVAHEGGVSPAVAHELVTLGGRMRQLRERGQAEVPSTRVLVAAARLIASGIQQRRACYAAIVAPLSDDHSLAGAMDDLIQASFI
ncbi:CbbQ/NirQ/NorQ domain-containing protein [Pseudoduganella sp. HUAS MS19]